MATYAQAQDTSFNDVNDTLEYTPVHRGSTIQVTTTDADQQTIRFQRDQGGGSWKTIQEWDHGDAAVTFIYKNADNSKLRLYLHDDDGGSNTVTITELVHTVDAINGSDGKPLTSFNSFEKDQIASTGSKSFRQQVSGHFVGATETASFTASPEKHAGRVTKLDGSGGALTITLPSSTGTLDEYTFMSVVDPGTNDIVISCDTDAGAFLGAIHVMTDGSAPTPFASDQATNDLITLNNTTTGGLGIGDWITVKDVGTDLWMVWGQVVSSGAEATPFSGS